MKKLLVVGHGMVAQRLLEKLVSNGSDWEITVIGEEPEAAYNRIMLSPFLAGDMDEQDLPLAQANWYAQHGIRCLSGKAAVAIDRSARRVSLSDGSSVDYDHLVLATGAKAAVPDLPGSNLDGVQVFRSRADCERLRQAPAHARRAVVIGGGFLGLEAAAGLHRRGLQVTVLHRSGHLLNRQLDERAGLMLQTDLAEQGLELRCNTQVQALEGKDRVDAVRLGDGTLIPAQVVVFATGIRPRIELAREAGLDCGRGIQVDGFLGTSDPHISALGECCQYGEQTYGLVEPGYKQAAVLAAYLARRPSERSGYVESHPESYRDTALATRLKISGIELFSCGEIEASENTESLVYQDQDLRHYRHLLVRNHRLVGAILYGDAREGPWYFQQLQKQTDISTIRRHLAFGAAYCDAA